MFQELPAVHGYGKEIQPSQGLANRAELGFPWLQGQLEEAQVKKPRDASETKEPRCAFFPLEGATQTSMTLIQARNLKFFFDDP